MKILVCDDHALFREGLELVLGQLDPTAEPARSPRRWRSPKAP
jgi:DNA-binding NarL/FixJ family response regulator